MTGAAGRDPVPAAATLYLDGRFLPSESGRAYPVADARGTVLGQAAQASRRDARDGVAAARRAFGRWSAAPASRCELLFRVAELMQRYRERLVTEVGAADGLAAKRAAVVVDTAVDRWVWYAGWADKIGTVLGGANPVAGPYCSVTTPEPTGVVGLLAPQPSSLLGLVSVLAPVIAAGNTAVLVASQNRPLPAVTLAEVLAAAELDGGVVNLLTGRTAELAPWLAAHGDVAALDLCGAPAAIRTDLERTAAGTVKRVCSAPAADPDWTRPPGIARLRAFVEAKTVWQPAGS